MLELFRHQRADIFSLHSKKEPIKPLSHLPKHKIPDKRIQGINLLRNPAFLQSNHACTGATNLTFEKQFPFLRWGMCSSPHRTSPLEYFPWQGGCSVLQRGPLHPGIGFQPLKVCADGWNLSTGPEALGTNQMIDTQFWCLLGYPPWKYEEQTPWLGWH